MYLIVLKLILINNNISSPKMSDFEKEIDQLPEDYIIGKSLKGRYTIDKYLDRGENGLVYVVTD